MRKSFVQRIDDQGLCLGCGMCQTVGGEENISMEMRGDGFYHPKIENNDVDHIIKQVCPSYNVKATENNDTKKNLWGSCLSIYSGSTTDLNVRNNATSGGVISQIAIELLEDKKSGVDAVLHVKADSKDYKLNRLKISKTKDEILQGSSSRYAPALVFSDLMEIMESTDENFLFIGKPCDVSGLQNFINYYKKYNQRIVYTISIMCAGIPSLNATDALIDSFKPHYPIKNLQYRGKGWPGNFSFRDKEGKEFEKSYSESWGEVLGKNIHLRCKLCPDGIGLTADLAIGDSWETKDGYPDFEEKDGKSLLLVRNKRGSDLIEDLLVNKKLKLTTLDVSSLKNIQPFQYHRRKAIGIRLVAFFMTRFYLFNYQNLNIINNALSFGLKKTIRELGGSLKRFSRR